MIKTFFLNLAVLITVIILLVKFLHHFYSDGFKHIKKMYSFFSAISGGIFAILTMLFPFNFNGVILDLKSVPILFISYILGFKYGLITTLIPIFFRLYIGGNTIDGVIWECLLPLIVGSIFQKHNKSKIPFKINIIKITKLLLLIQLIKFLGKIIFFKNLDFLMILYIDSFQLFFSLLALIIIVWLINDEHRKLQVITQLNYYANHDLMTGLLNLRKFMDMVGSLLENKVLITICMIDIDYFKRYNDTFGHLEGDKALRKVGYLLEQNIREQDLIARYGGEEFIACLYGIKEDEIRNVIERLRRKVEEHKFYDGEKMNNQSLTISIGYSFSDKNKELNQLIKEADKALYISKDKGRNRISSI